MRLNITHQGLLREEDYGGDTMDVVVGASEMRRTSNPARMWMHFPSMIGHTSSTKLHLFDSFVLK